MDRSSIIKTNFPSFFSDEEYMIYESENLMESSQFSKSQPILQKYLSFLTDQQLLQYLHRFFLPNKQIPQFIDLIYKKYELDNKFSKQVI